jgi:hypothetical protein
MNSDTAIAAVNRLRDIGARLSVENGNVRIAYRCAPAQLPTVKKAISVVRQHKAEVIACLGDRGSGGLPHEALGRPETRMAGRTGIGWDALNWQSDSLQAERRFGMAARLYPFIGRKVRTPQGVGKLVQVFRDRATVVVEDHGDENRQALSFAPTDIFPIGIM